MWFKKEKMKFYKCSKGHTWGASGRHGSFEFNQGNFQEDIRVCLQCLAEDLKKKYGNVKEV